MCFKNTLNSYGLVAKGLHWVMGLLIIGLLAVGLLLERFENTPTFGTLITLHKEFGIIVLTLAVFRLGWKVLDISPSLPAHMGGGAKIMAKLGHFGLYALMFAMPITGWLVSNGFGYPVSMFGLFNMPMLVEKDVEFAKQMGELHETFAWVMMGLLALHILAALLHHFYYKDDILKRMMPKFKK